MVVTYLFNDQWRTIERDLIIDASALLMNSVGVSVGELSLPDALGFLECRVIAGRDITLIPGR